MNAYGLLKRKRRMLPSFGTFVSILALLALTVPDVSAAGGPRRGRSNTGNQGRDLNTPTQTYMDGARQLEGDNSMYDGEGDYYDDGMNYGGDVQWEKPEDPSTSDALEGQRVLDALSFRMNPNSPKVLSDVRKKKILDEERAGYGSKVNGLYVKTEPESKTDYVGGETFATLRLNIGLLKSAHKMNPLHFFGMTAMSMDRSSSLPYLNDKIEERNHMIYKSEGKSDYSGWSKTFLQAYRINPADPSKASEFFKLHMPAPPDPPTIPPPPGSWRPPVYEKSKIVAAMDRFMQGQTIDPLTDPDGTRRIKIESDKWKELKDAKVKAAFLAQYGPQQNQGGLDGMMMMGEDAMMYEGGYDDMEGTSYQDNGS